MTVGRILEITFVLVLVYLVVKNWFGFTQIISTTGGVYVNAVKALQGQ